MTAAALIPARAGSEGVPQKNVRKIGTLSLVERAVLCALKVPELKDRVYVSTDDDLAERQARQLDPRVRVIERPSPLAASETPMKEVIQHALLHMNPKPEILVLLQPTTPSRTWEMVQDAIQMLKRSDMDSVVSVIPIPLTYSPDMVMTILDHQLYFYAADVATHRQEATPVFARDGSVYAFKVAMFEQTGSIYGTKCRPYLLRPGESLNIDTPEDWDRACALLR